LFSEQLASQPDRGWNLIGLWLFDDQQPLTKVKTSMT
jgi:hypothetical protein